jgi:HAMP domain-containing protein
VSKKSQLSHQLEDLFSDLEAPEPYGARPIPQQLGQEQESSSSAEPALDEKRSSDLGQVYDSTSTPSNVAVASTEDELLSSLEPISAFDVPPADPPEKFASVASSLGVENPASDQLDPSRPQSHQPSEELAAEPKPRSAQPWQAGLGRKLVIAFLAAAIIPSLIVATFGVVSHISFGRTNVTNNLHLIATLQENQVEQWAQSQIAALSVLAHEPTFERQIRNYLVADQGRSGQQAVPLAMTARLDTFLVQHPAFVEISLLDAEGRIVASTETSHQGTLRQDERFFTEGQRGRYFAPANLSEMPQGIGLVIAEPLRYITGEVIGVLIGAVDPLELSGLMQKVPGLGQSGQTYLINDQGELITELGTERAPPSGSSLESFGVTAASAGQSGSGTYSNYSGRRVLGVYRWLPDLQIGLVTERELVDAYGSLIFLVGGTILVALIAVALTAVLGNELARRIAQPLVDMTAAAQKMMAGDLNQSVKVYRTDEIGTLGLAFNHLASQLRTTISGLEETVVLRTRQLQRANDQYRKRAVHLETSSEISRAAASILDPEELMQTSVDLIRDGFGLYHVSLFLLEQTGECAVVVASTGEIGKQMMAGPHRLRVGGESMVGWACATKRPRIALDVGADAVHFNNPLLPDTRSEMVLPLVVGEKLLGALDVQSVEERAFDDEDIRSLQGMADLIAISLQNARLFSETQRTAQHQSLVNRVTDHLQRVTNIDGILTVTLQELAESFDLAQATVLLGTDTELSSAGNNRGEKTDEPQRQTWGRGETELDG